MDAGVGTSSTSSVCWWLAGERYLGGGAGAGEESGAPPGLDVRRTGHTGTEDLGGATGGHTDSRTQLTVVTVGLRTSADPQADQANTQLTAANSAN